MTVDAYHEIRKRALERIDDSGLDPEKDTTRLVELLRATVDDYQRQAHLGESRSLVDPDATVERLLQSVSYYGPLGDLLDREDVEEIFIEGARVTYLEAGGRLRGLDQPSTEAENRQVVERLMAATDRRLDASHPVSQARILDGTARITAVIPPIADRLSATIRRYALRKETLTSLVDLGSLSRGAADFMALAMRASTSVLVSGPPGAGKTSFLSALIAAVPADHCIRACEEIRELHVPIVHGSSPSGMSRQLAAGLPIVPTSSAMRIVGRPSSSSETSLGRVSAPAHVRSSPSAGGSSGIHPKSRPRPSGRAIVAGA